MRNTLKLTCAIGNHPRSRPILEGTVKPVDIDLTCSALHGSEIFFRQLKYKEFRHLRDVEQHR